MEPAVSIVIPTYNRAVHLPLAIRSVLGQSFYPFELIIVDDGSMDETGEVVRSFGDPRIRYLEHPGNRGGGAARNTGIGIARGRYIAFLDSDDEWVPDKLERQMEVFERLDDAFVLVHGGFRYRYDDGSTANVEPSGARGNLSPGMLRENCIPATSTVMVRTPVVRELGGFDERLPSCQDWDLWIRMSEKGSAEYVGGILGTVTRHEASITGDLGAVLAGHEMILAKYRDRVEELGRDAVSAHFFRMGYIAAFRFGDGKRGRKYLRRAIMWNPLSLSACKYYVLSWLNRGGYRLLKRLRGRR